MKKSLLICSLIFVSLILFTGCSSDSTDTATTDHHVEVIRLAGGTDWGSPNPFLNVGRGPGVGKTKLIFDSLLEADESGIIPWLATEWSVEGNVFTFKLKEDAAFHDGTPLTTADVAFTIDYYKAHPPVSNPISNNLIQSYEIVDPGTIKISVEKPQATTIAKLGSFQILPKHIWEKVADPATFNSPEAFIGSGSYKFSSYDAAAGSYEFIANEDYSIAKPAADKIQFVPVSDPLLAFENNEIDICDVPVDVLEKYEKDDSIGIITKDNDMGYRILINFEKIPVFNDLNLRAALYQGIDRQGIVDKVFRGSGAVGSAGYVPPTNLFFSDKVKTYDYNKEAALAAFKDKNIQVKIAAGNSGADVKIAELVKLNLEEIGIGVEIAAYDTQVRDDKVYSGDYEMAIVGNGGWGREPDYLRTIYSANSKNKAKSPASMGPIGWDNPEITQLAEDQLKEMDPEKRKEMFKALQDKISQEIPIIVLATQTTNVIYRPDYYDGWTKTYDYQQFEQNRLSYVEQ